MPDDYFHLGYQFSGRKRLRTQVEYSNDESSLPYQQLLYTSLLKNPIDENNVLILNGLVVCHNGTIYQYKDRQDLNVPSIETSITGFMRREYISMNNLYVSQDINMAHQEHIAILEEELWDAGIVFKEVLYNAK